MEITGARLKFAELLEKDLRDGNLSERKLMDCLNRLGYDIEIKVKPARASLGHLVLSFA